MVLGAGKPEQADKGKKIMIDAIKGLVVILGAYGILRTIFFLITG
jgi:hypothetical protein